jgi:predicted small secreted protein
VEVLLHIVFYFALVIYVCMHVCGCDNTVGSWSNA